MIRTSTGIVPYTYLLPLAASVLALVSFVAGLEIAAGGWVFAAVIAGAILLIGVALQGPYVVLLVWMALSPFMQGRVIDLGIGLPDMSVDRTLLLLAAALMLTQIATRRRSFIRLGLEEICLMPFFAWGAFSILLNPVQPLGQLAALVNQFAVPIMTYWIVRQVVTSERQISQMLLIGMVALILLSLPTPLEEIVGTNLLGQPSEHVAGIIRVRSFTRTAWEFGSVAAVLLAFSTHALSPRGEGRRRIGLAAVLLGSIAIFFTFMRASWLAAAAVLLITGTLNRQFRPYVYPALVIFVIVFLIFLPSIQQTEVWTSRVVDDYNIVGREKIFQQQLEMFAASPLFGQGLGATFVEYPISGGSWSFQTIMLMSHNTYMSMLVDFGLLGLTYFASILLILGKSVSAYRRLQSSHIVGRELIIALWAAIAVFVIEAATFETRLFTSINTLLWLSLGLLVVVSEMVKNENIGDSC